MMYTYIKKQDIIFTYPILLIRTGNYICQDNWSKQLTLNKDSSGNKTLFAGTVT